MIRGIGTDIVEIIRIRKAVSRESFLRRVFTRQEVLAYEQRGRDPQILAGYFAAKEAFAKAVGTGFRGFAFQDVEILNDKWGKPILRLSERLEYLNGYHTHVSISHSKENAVAVVILEE